jgi:hypothetical protein
MSKQKELPLLPLQPYTCLRQYLTKGFDLKEQDILYKIDCA